MKGQRNTSALRTKAPRRKVSPKRRPSRSSASDDGLSAPDSPRELNDAREQLKATSEVLHLMSGIAERSCRRIQDYFGQCDAPRRGELRHSDALRNEGRFRVSAMHNPPPKFAELRRREPTIRPGPLARYQTKFVYDVWGDTVNTASRMESHLLPGHIQRSAATKAALGDRFLSSSSAKSSRSRARHDGDVFLERSMTFFLGDR